MNRIRTGIFVIALLAGAGDAGAHARSESYSNWTLGSTRATATVTVSSGEVASIMNASVPESIDALFARHLAETVALSAAGQPCDLATSTPLAAARGFVRVELGFSCPGEPDAVRYRALFDALPAHVHYARFTIDGTVAGEQVFTQRATGWQLGERRPDATFLSFLELGIRHILGGLDHIAFLIGLLLVAGSVRRSVIAVTGFTLGHSLSLGAAVLGYVAADARLVESFIGSTVLLVAVEYFASARRSAAYALALLGLALVVGGLGTAFGATQATDLFMYAGFGLFAACYLALARGPATTAPRGWLLLSVTVCFGLVHGFGFAGFLMDSGATGGALALPLFGFNLGVEVGQLLLVAAALGIAFVTGREKRHAISPALAAALAGIGMFWFIGRSLAA